jgi:hypothetical protein
MSSSWEAFEIEVNEFLKNQIEETEAKLVSEYNSRETSKGLPILEVSVGATGSEEESFGDGVGSIDIHYGTVNLSLKFSSDIGLIKAVGLINKLISLFSRRLMQGGYAKFGVPYKIDNGQDEGYTRKTVICPFTLEIVN